MTHPPSPVTGYERYMTVKEVATILRVSKQSVYRMTGSGEIESVRVGRRAIRIPESAVRAFIRPNSPDGFNSGRDS